VEITTVRFIPEASNHGFLETVSIGAGNHRF